MRERACVAALRTHSSRPNCCEYHEILASKALFERIFSELDRREIDRGVSPEIALVTRSASPLAYLPEPEARSVTWRNPRPPAHRKKDRLTLARALTRASRSPPAPRSVGC